MRLRVPRARRRSQALLLGARLSRVPSAPTIQCGAKGVRCDRAPSFYRLPAQGTVEHALSYVYCNRIERLRFFALVFSVEKISLVWVWLLWKRRGKVSVFMDTLGSGKGARRYHLENVGRWVPFRGGGRVLSAICICLCIHSERSSVRS